MSADRTDRIAAWTQTARPFRLKSTLGDNVLLLVHWEGEEHLSAFFRFHLSVISARKDLTAKDLLLKPVTLELRLESGTLRTVHGIVSRLTCAGTSHGYTAYELEMVPPHWVLSGDEGFDIFQGKSARDVVDAMLQGTPHDWKLTRTLDPRPYCIRYRESRWQCAARLLEQEGIWFRFDHTGSDAKIVLHDSVASAQPAWGVTKLEVNAPDLQHARLSQVAQVAQPYVAETQVRSASEFLATKNVTHTIASSGAFTPPSELRAYVFDQQATAHRSGIKHGGGESAADAAKLPDDVKTYARLRQERAEARAVVVQGRSGYIGLETGARTEVVGHPTAALNGSVFITSVWHQGSNGAYEAGNDAQWSYENRFEAIPATTPFRPARVTPWPQVGGAHVGVVVGPPGEEIYTDKYGRVQVVFRWDAEDKQTLERACWIRVAQAFAGQQFGSVFLPRVGHEVLVEFLDGNPDTPVIVGSLYNSANLPPWTLPDHKTRSGVKTHSTLRGGPDHFNELRFEDKKGEEQVYLHAERNLDTMVEADETRQVGNDRTTVIHHADHTTVEEADDTTIVKKGKQVITVEDNDREITVAKNQVVTIGKEETRDIGASLTEIIGDQRSVDVGDRDRLKVGQSQDVTISKKRTLKIGDSDAETVGANRSVSVGGNYEITVDGSKMSITSMAKIELKVGANSIVIDQSGITITGVQVKVEGKAQATVQAPMTQVKGDGMVMVKGGITMIN